MYLSALFHLLSTAAAVAVALDDGVSLHSARVLFHFVNTMVGTTVGKRGGDKGAGGRREEGRVAES